MGRHDPLLVPYAQGLGIPEPSVVVYGFTGRMGNLIDGSSQRCLGRVVRMRRFDRKNQRLKRRLKGKLIISCL